MILDDIKSQLEMIDKNSFYGLADRREKWNYLVFTRVKTSASKNNTGSTTYYAVGIVRENYIEEGLADLVIDAMKEIPGIKRTSDDITYSYVKKPNTNVVVEIAEIMFCKAEKK